MFKNQNYIGRSNFSFEKLKDEIYLQLLKDVCKQKKIKLITSQQQKYFKLSLNEIGNYLGDYLKNGYVILKKINKWIKFINRLNEKKEDLTLSDEKCINLMIFKSTYSVKTFCDKLKNNKGIKIVLFDHYHFTKKIEALKSVEEQITLLWKKIINDKKLQKELRNQLYRSAGIQ